MSEETADDRTMSIGMRRSDGTVTTSYNVNNIAYLDVASEAQSPLLLRTGILAAGLIILLSLVRLFIGIPEYRGVMLLLQFILFTSTAGAVFQYSKYRLHLGSALAIEGAQMVSYFFYITLFFWFLFLSLVVAGILWYVLRYGSSSDGIVVGTISHEDYHELHQAGSFEDRFLDRVAETITVTGRDDGFLTSMEYSYHFVPDNIVSVEHRKPHLTWLQWALIMFVSILTLLIVIVLRNENGGIAMLIAVLVVGGIAAAGLYFYFLETNDTLTIYVQGGNRRSFRMNTEDTDQFVSQFTNR